jgi:uncharacterized protein DUF1214
MRFIPPSLRRRRPTVQQRQAIRRSLRQGQAAACECLLGAHDVRNERQLFTPNPINRYAIGDRDKLVFNADGSLDLFVQRDTPGADKESNWLPTPKSGSFTLNLRVYWPKAEMLDGSWLPSPVKRMN